MAVIRRGVGRNPLDSESDTVVTTVRFTRAVRDRITALVGGKGMADFIRDAIDAELPRREREAKRQSAAKTLDQ